MWVYPEWLVMLELDVSSLEVSTLLGSKRPIDWGRTTQSLERFHLRMVTTGDNWWQLVTTGDNWWQLVHLELKSPSAFSLPCVEHMVCWDFWDFRQETEHRNAKPSSIPCSSHMLQSPTHHLLQVKPWSVVHLSAAEPRWLCYFMAPPPHQMVLTLKTIGSLPRNDISFAEYGTWAYVSQGTALRHISSALSLAIWSACKMPRGSWIAATDSPTDSPVALPTAPENQGTNGMEPFTTALTCTDSSAIGNHIWFFETSENQHSVRLSDSSGCYIPATVWATTKLSSLVPLKYGSLMFG